MNRRVAVKVALRVMLLFINFRFPSGRWFGRGVDDESIERLLIGELVPRIVETESGSRENTLERFRTPPRTRSPSVTRIELKPAEIQHMLGNCVNAIVKWHYKPTRDRDASSLTKLLCGEGKQDFSA